MKEQRVRAGSPTTANEHSCSLEVEDDMGGDSDEEEAEEGGRGNDGSDSSEECHVGG